MRSFIGFLTGVVLFYTFLYFPFSTVCVGLLCGIGLLLKKWHLPLMLLVIGTAFAFMRYDPPPEVPYGKDKIAVKGVFESYPVEPWAGRYRQVFTVASAEDVITGGKITALAGRDIVLFSERAFDPGKEYTLGITLLKDRNRLNPGEPSREVVAAYLEDVYHAGNRRTSLRSIFEGYRHKINAHIEEHMQNDSAALVRSITTGRAASMSEEGKNAFNNAGLAHILSISGSHFGLFSVILFGIFKCVITLLPYRVLQRITIYLTPSQTAAILCVPFMLSYLALSGASIPALRAFIMISLFLFGLVLGKKGYWLNSLLLAAFIITLWEPKAIFSISFQLSFVAVLFIGLALQATRERRKEGGKASGYFGNAVLMTLSASLGTAPLVAYYFHYFSIISPVSNLILAPLIGFLLIPVSVMSSFLFLLTGHFLSTPVVSWLADFSIAAVKALSGVPYASVSVPAFPPVLLLIFYPGVIGFLVMNNLRNRRDPLSCRPDLPPADVVRGIRVTDDKTNVTDQDDSLKTGSSDAEPESSGMSRWKERGILALSLVPMVIYAFLMISEKRDLRVTFLDVGQGDSAVVEFPDGRTMLIDTGKTGQEAAAFLRYKGKSSVDYLVLSHAHPDHAGGLETVRRRLRVGEIWDNGLIAYPEGLVSRALSRGDTLEADGYRIYVLHPASGFYTMNRSDYVSENNDSLVLKIEGAGLSFLFAGDIEKEAEEEILRLGGWIKSDVVKVPHHGGRTSAVAEFFTGVSPDVAIVSAGRDNSFGHPHREMLEILHRVRTYRTDIDGAVRIRRSYEGREITTYRDTLLKQTGSLGGELRNIRLLFMTW